MDGEKADEILQQMRLEAGARQHLDQQKIRAKKALQIAIEKRDFEACLRALKALGIDMECREGQAFIKGFRQLPPIR